MISEQAYALCMAIEELPASEMQTQISVMAAELRAKVAGVEEENVRLRPRAEIAGSLLTRTSKAEKRCRELEEELTLCLKEAPVGILAAICDMNKILGLEMPKTSYTEIPPAIQAVVDRVRELETTIDTMTESHAHDDQALTAAYLSGAHAGKKQAEAFKARVMAWARGRCECCRYERGRYTTSPNVPCNGCMFSNKGSRMVDNWVLRQAWEVGE